MGKLIRLLSRARHLRTALPLSRKRVWATELVWVSHPPDPAGVPLLRQARWLEQALFILRREGVSAASWLQISDDPPRDRNGLDGGLYFASGRAKPAARAFRFPFVTTRSSPSSIRVWGRAPAAGLLVIERAKGSHWVTVARRHVRRLATFYFPVRLAGSVTLRARVGRVASLTWHQAA
jgi:hypothetical protein